MYGSGLNKGSTDIAHLHLQAVLEPSADDVVYVEASVRNVWINLGIGAVLATVVLFLFLRSVPATLVGVMGIPLCTLAAFAFARSLCSLSAASISAWKR